MLKIVLFALLACVVFRVNGELSRNEMNCKKALSIWSEPSYNLKDNRQFNILYKCAQQALRKHLNTSGNFFKKKYTSLYYNF